MEVLKTIAEMRQARKASKKTMGFVPTMGYLHEGHISLVRQAREKNKLVAVSIFVNPTQFGPKEDFRTYPRDTKHDLSMLKPHTDFVFMPSDEEMYPEGYDSWVEVKGITDMLEGSARPGHFRGVSTVVLKLFNIVQPNRAYFGQKDAQQLAVIKKMVKDFDVNIDIVACPTVRESDGLAMSSRNTYLTPEQRRSAPVLYQSLQLAQELAKQGEWDALAIRKEMTKLIQKESQADIEYISIADNETLKEIHRIKYPALVSMAVRFGRTRLIDNLVLEE
ncbi:MAG: pantoate--beta-alanine ligase [Dehalococcoidales bacterium]|nr:pantoate--beta-alanine ligase [Dehalococcoidales bacterium]